MRRTSGIPSSNGRNSASLRLRMRLKRLIDIVASFLIIVLLLPVFAVASVAILIGSGRPIFYRQTRIGLFGEPFVMVKFRSMTTNAHSSIDVIRDQNDRSGPLFKMTNDPRVTGVGRVLRKLSIDELPQLFNVLAGTMSLVGPRPALPEEVETFPAELRARESVPQGLTGLWQLEGRMDADFEKYRSLDLSYVENWCLRLDLKILVKTPFVVARQALRRTEVVPNQTSAHALELKPLSVPKGNAVDVKSTASLLEPAE